MVNLEDILWNATFIKSQRCEEMKIGCYGEHWEDCQECIDCEDEIECKESSLNLKG